MMRLSQQEIDAIISSIAPHIKTQAELRLFGSRIDDKARGGDIDLLLVIKTNHDRSVMLSAKCGMLADIKEKIGDQKIDLLIRFERELESDPFLKIIFPQSVCLKKWE